MNAGAVPALAPGSQAATESAGAAGSGAPGTGLDPINILIVDDEPKNLVVLETVLENPGYRLVRANSADQALLALVEEEFALLILDIRMPGMTGFELAQMIRQRRRTAQVPIIFLTAYYNEDQHVLEGYGTGAVDYLHKPVNPVILRSKVAIFADLHRKTRELGTANRALLAEVTERRAAQAQLRELNETLEHRVAERTQVLEAAREELRASDEKKDHFIATLAHELRNPLAPIRNAAGVMRRVEQKDSQLAWCRDVIERQVAQMAHLLDDLLDVSRITQGKLVLRREPLTLAMVIERAIEIARPFIDAAGQAFNAELPPQPVTLSGDLTRLAQVVSNLLINAAKYTPADGRIVLRVQAGDDVVVVAVEDSGIGIAPEHLPAVFEMFGQVSSAVDRSQGGLGIGLSLARALVEMHGGELSARSEGLGKGSRFTMRLPREQAGVASAPSGEAAPTEPGGAPVRHRILVADDLRDSADTLGMVLETMGHEVRVCYDGAQAVRLAEEFQPRVLFIDLGMPGVSGYEACRRIRSHPWGSSMTLVAQTGWGQAGDRQRTREAGFDHHMVKPLERRALDALLRNVGAGPSA